jgi:hypothetical protein
LTVFREARMPFKASMAVSLEVDRSLRSQ